jgi:hypothetical protein
LQSFNFTAICLDLLGWPYTRLIFFWVFWYPRNLRFGFFLLLLWHHLVEGRHHRLEMRVRVLRHQADRHRKTRLHIRMHKRYRLGSINTWVDRLLLWVYVKIRPFRVFIRRFSERILNYTRELRRRLNLLRILNKLLWLPLFEQYLILVRNARRDVSDVPHNLLAITSKFNSCVERLRN